MSQNTNSTLGFLLAFATLIPACGGSSHVPKTSGINHSSCNDFSLDVQRFWFSDSKAEVTSGIRKVSDDNKANQVSDRALTQLDQLTTEWVIISEKLCKDALIRKEISQEDYLKISSCLSSSLQQQRSLVEILKDASKVHLENVDAAIAKLHQNSIDCEKKFIYNSYDEAETDDAARVARSKIAESRLYVELKDHRAIEAAKEAEAAATQSHSIRVKVDALMALAEAPIGMARYTAEVPYLVNKALELARSDDYDAGIAAALTALGHIYLAQGDSRHALATFEELLVIYRKSLDAEDLQVAAICSTMAIIYDNQENYSRARTMNEKALAIRLKYLGPEHPDVADSYNNLGTIYNHLVDYPHALVMYEKALAIDLKTLGTKDPRLAPIYSNLGNLYSAQANYSHALAMHEKALAIALDTFDAEHPFVAVVFSNTGMTYQLQGNYPRALAMFNKALAIRLKVYGAEHPYVAMSYSNIGDIYYSQGKYPHALAAYKKALAIYTKSFGLNHPEVTAMKDNVRSVCSKGYKPACSAN